MDIRATLNMLVAAGFITAQEAADATNIWFVSDLHLAHAAMLAGRGMSERPFSNTPAMDLFTISRINKYVGPKDIVFFLGDLCMGQIDMSMAMAAFINGIKISLGGNHDRTFVSSETRGGNMGYDEWVEQYAQKAGIRFVGHEFTMSHDGLEFMCCHFPYEGDSRDDGERYADERPTFDGLPLVHGHLHERNRTSRYTDPATGRTGAQVNVGFDAWLRPLSIDEIVDMLRADVGLTVPPEDRWATTAS